MQTATPPTLTERTITQLRELLADVDRDLERMNGGKANPVGFQDRLMARKGLVQRLALLGIEA